MVVMAMLSALGPQAENELVEIVPRFDCGVLQFISVRALGLSFPRCATQSSCACGIPSHHFFLPTVCRGTLALFDRKCPSRFRCGSR